MPSSRRKRKGQTKVNPSAQVRAAQLGRVWGGGVDSYSGRENAGEGGSDLDKRGEGNRKGYVAKWGKA